MMKKLKIYQNLQIEDLKSEVWLDVFGYDGIYHVSNLGRVKSLQRLVMMRPGVFKLKKEKIMKQLISKSSLWNLKEPTRSLHVTLSVENKRKTVCVSTIVGIAFVGELKKGEVYSKKDKVWHNNKADNFKISTYTECVKLSYLLGNNLRKKECLMRNNKPKYKYKRASDGKEFVNKELVSEYGLHASNNIRHASKTGSSSYKTKWIKIKITH